MFRAFALVGAACVLAACGGDNTAKKPASQVAAKVNKSEITVHQINGAMANAGFAVPQDQAKDVSGQVLERLIDQELLVQQAGEKKLERSATVLQALESSRRQILSQAYLEQLVANIPRPTQEQARKFYAENPALFAQRRVYRLREITVAAGREEAARLAQAAEAARSAAEFVQQLKARGVSYTEAVTTKPAEQINLAALPRLNRLGDGQLMVLPAATGFVAVQLLESQLAPVAEKDAIPFIEQYLTNQEKMRITQAEVKRLRDTAKIEYGDAFVAATQTAAPAAPATESATAGPGNVEKGVRGLK